MAKHLASHYVSGRRTAAGRKMKPFQTSPVMCDSFHRSASFGGTNA
jgi:hypothetical protein